MTQGVLMSRQGLVTRGNVYFVAGSCDPGNRRCVMAGLVTQGNTWAFGLPIVLAIFWGVAHLFVFPNGHG